MKINPMIKNGCSLIRPSDFTTEIPAGTNNNPMLSVNAVPTRSTCPNLTIPVHKHINNNTSPITDAGIGIGINDSIILEISKITDITMT